MEWLALIGGSRLANIVLALLVGFAAGWLKNGASWRAWEADQQKIRDYNHQVELAREAQNAVEIAKAATERVEEDEAELAKLRKRVSDFDEGATNAKDPCLMSDRLVGAAERMRQPPHRTIRAKITRPPKGPH